jgi:hypothetical protein
VAILAAVFDRKWVKLKDVEKHSLIGFIRRLHIDPDDG